MIIIEDNRIFCLYCRTNRRVKWQYSTYGGRYETRERAIAVAKEHYPDQKTELLIKNDFDGTSETLFINNG